MKIDITLTREDLIDWKRDLHVNDITLLDCFKMSVLTQSDILKAHTILFVDEDRVTILKCRD